MAVASFPLPVDTAPMKAKLVETIPEDGGPWQYEPKWDGFRCLAFKAGDAVDIRAKWRPDKNPRQCTFEQIV